MEKYKLICKRYCRTEKTVVLTLHINKNKNICRTLNGELYFTGFSFDKFTKIDTQKYIMIICNKIYHIDDKKVNVYSFDTIYKSVSLFVCDSVRNVFCFEITKSFDKNKIMTELYSCNRRDNQNKEYYFNIKYE